MAYPFRDERPSRVLAWGTWLLLLICVVTFAFAQPKPMQGLTHGLTVEENAAAILEIRAFQDRWALVPCEITHGRSISAGAPCDGYPVDRPDAYADKNIWVPFLTALFLHANLLHLFGNMLFLWVFGRGLEERIGTAGIVALFVAGGIAAFLGYVAVAPETALPVLGASGAVAAVMGAYLVLQPTRRILSFVYAAGVQVVYLPAWAVLAFFFVAQFFTAPHERVAWQAHVAGMIFGMGVAAIWRWRDPALAASHPSTESDQDRPEPDPAPADAWTATLPEGPPVAPEPSGALSGPPAAGPAVASRG